MSDMLREEEFTCNDGQCIPMTKRCDQLPDCRENPTTNLQVGRIIIVSFSPRDGSDEQECRLLVLTSGYNMKIPPITTDDQRNIVPVQVRISIILMKIVQIKEVDHKIEFQFGIVLEWPEIRALFHNLKFKSSLNALTDEEISQLWLPYVIYDNTDMKEVVQLEEGTKTTVTVTRQGDFTRSGVEVADEIEVFEGGENKLTMNQTYSKKFQCEYQLHRYPFDIQVVSSPHSVTSLYRYVPFGSMHSPWTWRR